MDEIRSATVGGEDGVVRKINDGQKQFNVAWDTALESWTTDPALGDGNPNLVYDRSGQMNSSSSETPVYWLAWEMDDNNKPITDVATLKKVVWKAVQYEGESLPQERWVMLSDDTQEWDPKIRKFITKKKV